MIIILERYEENIRLVYGNYLVFCAVPSRAT